MKGKTMKTVAQVMILPAVVLSCFTATAQRGDRMGHGNGADRGRSFNQPQRNQSTIQRNTFEQRQQPNINNTGRPPEQGNAYRNGPDPRDRYDNRSYNPRNNNVTVYNNRNYNYNGNRGGYYPQPVKVYHPAPFRYAYGYPYYGQRFVSVHTGCNIIPYGGIGYRYYNGIFYRPFGTYYQVIAPPVGISINILPFGYTRFYVGPVPYYFYGGVYYHQYDSYYQVVDPPLGAKLPALPRGAKEVYINGDRYFEENGTYYMEEFNENGQRLYTVVGVHGALDTEQVNRIMNGIHSGAVEQRTGGLYSTLPPNSYKVTIDGHEYYRSPDDVYYEEITDGDNVSYQVVSN